MDGLMLPRLRWFLSVLLARHGWLAALSMFATACAMVSLVWFGIEYARLQRAERALADIVREAHTGTQRPASTTTSDPAPAFPVASERHAINRRILDTLRRGNFHPEQVRFRFEDVPDASATREVAVFTVSSAWSDLAHLLESMQGLDRSMYISRLRVSRNTSADEQVTAEIQVAFVTAASSASKVKR